MSIGWIKLHREIMEWEWYTDPKTVHLFLHLILQANHKSKRWKGVKVERGQVITGRQALACATGLSEQQVRTVLNRLESTGEITMKSTNRFTVVTICNYERYQVDGNNCNCAQPTNNQQVTNDQPVDSQQVTTNKNEKKVNNEKKEPKGGVFNFLKALRAKGVEKQVAKDWMLVRSKKKAANTQTAFNGLVTQVEKSGKSWNEIITLCCEKSWVGFKAEWLANAEQQQPKFQARNGEGYFQEFTCP